MWCDSLPRQHPIATTDLNTQIIRSASVRALPLSPTRQQLIAHPLRSITRPLWPNVQPRAVEIDTKSLEAVQSDRPYAAEIDTKSLEAA
jgi:hypothetical protein